MSARNKDQSTLRKPCEKHLGFYCKFFEMLPGYWFVRGGRKQSVMPNLALRKLIGLKKRVLRWEEWFGSVNTRQLEDSISRSLKQNADFSEFTTTSSINLREGPQLKVCAVGMLVPCPIRCPQGCRLIVGHLKPWEDVRLKVA